MATKEPLVPSMIFRSRTTKALSNVTEQKACKRSFSLPSSMSLIRTSVITTVVLLYFCGTVELEKGTVPVSLDSSFRSRAASNDEHARVHPLLFKAAKPPADTQGLARVTTQGEKAAAAAAHPMTRCAQARQPSLNQGESRAERQGNRL